MSVFTIPEPRFIGCDVGKTSIVVFDGATSRTQIINNQPEDLASFACGLDKHCFVVCEATGGYEADLLTALTAAGIPAHRADARKVKAFIRSFGTLGKTDAIDAKALAHYAQERNAKLPRWQAPAQDRVTLQALVLTRRDLVAQHTAFTNRLNAPTAGPAKLYLEKVRSCLTDQIKAIDTKIETILQTSQPLKIAAEVLKSMTGIGSKTAGALIALMPELGTINRWKAAALGGVAPHPYQSGQTDGYRRTKGGRPEVKRALFMAALSAAKHDPKMKLFFQRLVANGKKPIVAIVAVMRKIIVIANARIRDAYLQTI